jgi:multiple sugar transport system permease protein
VEKRLSGAAFPHCSNNGAFTLKKKGLDGSLLGYLLLTPWLVGFLVMYLIPMGVSLYYSLTDYNMLKPTNFVGFSNYIRMFTQDKAFAQALSVTFVYVLILVPLRLAFALLIAMLINTRRKGNGAYRTAYYIPSIIGGSIAVSIVWKQIFGNGGAIMSLLDMIGFQQRLSFIGNPSTALGTIILLGVWQFGSSMLIFLAALKQVPVSLYESAVLDGSGAWRKFTNITLPMISPTILFNLIMQVINGFRAFTESYIITEGGPMDRTLFYVLYLYKRAFNYFEMGYSSAMAWVLVLIIAAFTLVIFRTQRNWVHYEN